MASTVKFLQDTDVGSTLQVKDNKIEVGKDVVVSDNSAGVIVSDKAVNFTYLKEPGDVFPEWRQSLTARPPTLAHFGIDFDELKAHMEAEFARDPTLMRVGKQEGSSAYAVYRDPRDPSQFNVTPGKTAGATGVLYPFSRVTQSASAPLFIQRKAGTGTYEPSDPTQIAATYNLIPEAFMVVEAGRTATLEFVVPFRLRSIELVTQGAPTGLVIVPLDAEVTYGDGTVESGRVYSYGTGWYFTGVLDNTKPVKSLKMTVPSDTASLGIASMLQLDMATGKTYGYGEAGFGPYTPVYRMAYLYPYQCSTIEERRWRTPSDITSQYAVTTNITAAAGTTVGALTDNDPATVYQASTNAASLSVTLTRTTDAPVRPQVVRITFAPNAGNELALSTLQSISISASTVNGSGSLVSTARWYRNVPATAGALVTFEVVAGSVNVTNDVAHKIVLTIAKLDTTKPYRLASVQVLGTADY